MASRRRGLGPLLLRAIKVCCFWRRCVAAARHSHIAHAECRRECAGGADFVSRKLALDFAFFQHRDACSDVEHQIQILLDDNHCQSRVLTQFSERFPDLLYDGRLDAFGWFVE